MLARRLAPIAALAALAVFLAVRIPNVVVASWKRVRAAWHDRALSADESLAIPRGPEYVAAIQRIREKLPPDSDYLLLSTPGGGDVFVRFDLAPRRAIFGGAPADIRNNVTPAKLRELPEWTVIPRLEPPGPRLVETRLLAEKGAIP